MRRRLVLAFLSVLASVPLSAREAPPRFLDIVQERLRPNSESAYDLIEQEIARTCKRLQCPNPYLALESTSGEKEVWWLNAYDSEVRREEVRKAYESNGPLMAALRESSRRKAALTYPPVSIAAQYRNDLSSESCWTIGRARFLVIAARDGGKRSDGCVFETSDGTQFLFMPAFSRRDAAGKATVTGSRIFALQPKWSLPAPAWIVANPEFWSQPRAQ